MGRDASRSAARGLMAHTGLCFGFLRTARVRRSLLAPLALRHAAGPACGFAGRRQLPPVLRKARGAGGSFRPLSLGVPFSVGRQARLRLAVSSMEISKDAALTHGGAYVSVRMVGVGGAPA